MAHAIPGSLQFKLRAKKPHYVLAFVRDEDEPKRINVQTTSTNRTKHCLDTLRDLDWQRVEMYDAKGGLLGAHERCVDDDPPPGEVETIGTGVAAGKMGELAMFAQILTRANDQVAERQAKLVTPLLDAFVQVVNVTVRRLDATSEDLDRQREREQQLQHARERELMKQLREAAEKATENGDESESGKMLQGMLPAILAAVMSPKTPAPAPAPAAPASNGASTASTSPPPAKPNGTTKKKTN